MGICGWGRLAPPCPGETCFPDDPLPGPGVPQPDSHSPARPWDAFVAMPRPPPEGIDISTDPRRLDVEALHAFLSHTYWSPGLPRAVLERALANSLCFGAYEGARQVGFARVVTDRATFAWVCDVFVVDSHRRRGIADALMAAVMAHPELQQLRRWSLATRDAHGLYHRHGFTAMEDPSRAMEIRRPDVYQTAPAPGGPVASKPRLS